MKSMNNRSSFIGIEIDSGEIRGVELGGTPKEPMLIAYGKFPLAHGIVENGYIMDIPGFSQALTDFHKKEGFSSRQVIAGVNSLDIILRIASFQKVPPEKLRKMVLLQAQEHIPVPLSELILDYLTLDEKQIENIQYVNTLLVAAKKQLIEGVMQGIDEAKLTIGEIDASILALGRAVQNIAEDKNAGFINISLGKEITGMLIYKGGHIAMARYKATLAFINSLITRSPGVAINQREIEDIAAALVEDIRTSTAYYYSQHSEKLNTVYLSGDISRFPGIEEIITKESGIETIIPDFYPNLKGREHLDLMEYAGCISLALRELED